MIAFRFLRRLMHCVRLDLKFLPRKIIKVYISEAIVVTLYAHMTADIKLWPKFRYL